MGNHLNILWGDCFYFSSEDGLNCLRQFKGGKFSIGWVVLKRPREADDKLPDVKWRRISGREMDSLIMSERRAFGGSEDRAALGAATAPPDERLLFIWARVSDLGTRMKTINAKHVYILSYLY